MHAIYSYLMHLDPEEGSSLEEVALSLFGRYAETHLDENNWWAPIDLVMKDGTYLHKFGEDVSDRYAASEEPVTWDRAIRFALDCVVMDLEVREDEPRIYLGEPTAEMEKAREAYDRLSFQEVVAFVNTEAPKQLSEMYKQVIGQPWEPDNRFHPEEYKRAKMAERYELFREAETIPFSRRMKSPYAYRAYDLTDSYAEGDPNAILRLDIHT